MKKHFTSIKKIIDNNMFLLKIALKEAPLSTLQALLWGVKHNVVVFIEHIFMISFIIDSIQYKKPFINVVVFVAIVFVCVTLINILGEYVNYKVRPKSDEKIKKRIRDKLYEKAKNIDLECYDNPEFYNDFIWAMNNATNKVNDVINSTARLLGAIAGVFVMGGYVFTHNKTGLFIVLASFFSMLFLGGKFRSMTFKLEEKLNPVIRKRDYINRIFYLNDYVKEIKLSNVKEKLIKDYKKSNDDIMDIYKKTTKKLALYNFLINYFCNDFIFTFIYISYLIYITVVKKAISYGTMVALNNTSNNLKRSMLEFGEVLPQFKEHSLYIAKIRKFLNYEIKIKSNPKTKKLPEDINAFELKNVSFSYSPDSVPVLDNVCMTIPAGSKIAIVGYNGAGKTTLMKMLMRLYDVSQGEILYGGVNIKDYGIVEYRNIFASLFQDYQIFAASIKENIVTDDTEIHPADSKKLEYALLQSGFGDKIEKLPDGIDSELTKEFDEKGTELSGGEKQKVSIARTLYKECRIIILDEPSSALDPISEYELNNTMLNIERDKTIIFISHRLSTTKMADKIYMFEKGKLIEQGSHSHLMNINGKYAEMFRLQSEKYR